MQLLRTERFGTLLRDFEIHAYRDNNSSSIVLEPVELTANSKQLTLSQFRSEFPIADLNLEIQEYPEYSIALAKVKNSLREYSDYS